MSSSSELLTAVLDLGAKQTTMLQGTVYEKRGLPVPTVPNALSDGVPVHRAGWEPALTALQGRWPDTPLVL